MKVICTFCGKKFEVENEIQLLPNHTDKGEKPCLGKDTIGVYAQEEIEDPKF